MMMITESRVPTKTVELPPDCHQNARMPVTGLGCANRCTMMTRCANRCTMMTRLRARPGPGRPAQVSFRVLRVRVQPRAGNPSPSVLVH
eukprot:1165502-Rhodomonas_salina.1